MAFFGTMSLILGLVLVATALVMIILEVRKGEALFNQSKWVIGVFSILGVILLVFGSRNCYGINCSMSNTGDLSGFSSRRVRF